MDDYLCYLACVCASSTAYYAVFSRTSLKPSIRREMWDLAVSSGVLIWTYRLLIQDTNNIRKLAEEHTDDRLDRYAMFNCAYYTFATLAEVPNVFRGRSDMFLHHVISAPMFAAAHHGRLTRLALSMMATTAPSTPFMSMAKLAYHLHHPLEKYASLVFAMVFVVSRVFAFPMVVLARILPLQPPPSRAMLLGQVGGSILYAMQLFWTLKIFQMMKKHSSNLKRMATFGSPPTTGQENRYKGGSAYI